MSIYRDPHRAHDEFTAYMADDDLPQRVIDYCMVRLTGLPVAPAWSATESDADREAERPT